MADPTTPTLVVTYPKGSALVNDYLKGAPSAEPFFGARYDRLTSFRDKASEVDGRFDRALRERAARALAVPGGDGAERLQRFVEEGGYMVTTGQQPALFGGPLYSVVKALTTARLAERLEQILERPVLPVFWVASEDHDWEEANHADVIGVDNELHRFAVDAPVSGARPSLHSIPLGTDADSVVEGLLAALPSTDFSGEYEALARAFGSGGTIPEAFHQMMGRLLDRFGIFLTDAADPVVKEASAATLLEEVDRSAELEGVLAETAASLEAAGYGLQVPVLEGGVNVFLEGPGGRERIYRDGDAFTLRTSGTRLTRADIEDAQEVDRRSLSPNVLLRPVVESVVFPTLAYVGGPGEIAYFGQLAEYFRAHGVRMPVVYPRWGVTVVERKVEKVLSKFEVEIADLHRPFHEIAGEMARDTVPDDVRAALGKLRGAIGAAAGELTSTTRAIDPTLKGPVQHLRSQAFAAVDDMEKKIVQAVKRETDISLAQLEKAQLHLYPNGKPAERVQSPFYYLFRYGDAFLDAMYARFDVNFDAATSVR